ASPYQRDRALGDDERARGDDAQRSIRVPQEECEREREGSNEGTDRQVRDRRPPYPSYIHANGHHGSKSGRDLVAIGNVKRATRVASCGRSPTCSVATRARFVLG